MKNLYKSMTWFFPISKGHHIVHTTNTRLETGEID